MAIAILTTERLFLPNGQAAEPNSREAPVT
jgi:hypothetical protein